jgi:hypothetical protein
MTIDSNDLALDSDLGSPDSGSNSNSTGFFQPGKLYEESHYGTMEHQGRGTPHVHLAVCREFAKENSLIRDRFGSRALAHLLRCERRLKRMKVIVNAC